MTGIVILLIYFASRR